MLSHATTNVFISYRYNFDNVDIVSTYIPLLEVIANKLTKDTIKFLFNTVKYIKQIKYRNPINFRFIPVLAHFIITRIEMSELQFVHLH